LAAQEYATEELGLYSTVTGKREVAISKPRNLGRLGQGAHAAFSSDGRVLAAAWREMISVRELAGQAPPSVIQAPEEVYSLAFAPDGRTVAVGLRTGGVALLDPAAGQWRATLRGRADAESIRCVRFSPDGTVLASGGVDRVIRLWNPASGEQLKTLVGHRDEVLAMAFSPDGRTLASVSADQTLRLWRVGLGRELLVLELPSKPECLAFSPDGMTLAVGTWVPDRGAVYLWRGKSPPAQAADETSEKGTQGGP